MAHEQKLIIGDEATVAYITHGWRRADEELPPPSIKVLVTDGSSIEYGWYDYYRNEWRSLMTKITHWMYLPELPKED